MIVQCSTCSIYFDHAYRLTTCPHGTFAANDGENRFAHHPESYYSSQAVTYDPLSFPGYYNHCAVCGFMACSHYPQENGKGGGYTIARHDFVMRGDERVMASAQPDWRTVWSLDDRLRKLEEEQ